YRRSRPELWLRQTGSLAPCDVAASREGRLLRLTPRHGPRRDDARPVLRCSPCNTRPVLPRHVAPECRAGHRAPRMTTSRVLSGAATASPEETESSRY